MRYSIKLMADVCALPMYVAPSIELKRISYISNVAIRRKVLGNSDLKKNNRLKSMFFTFFFIGIHYFVAASIVG